MKEIISAQVILKWRLSPPDSPKALITSETIGSYQLEQASIKEVMTFFSTNNFEVGVLVANNFSITAPKEHFQQIFEVKIQASETLGYRISAGKNGLLPLDKLPPDIRRHIECITFVEPPQFHQYDYNV